MKQKVIQIGSSAGITISKGTLEELGVEVGDFVNTRVENSALFVTPVKQKPQIDPKIIAWANEFIEKNRELLLRLADKKPEEIAAWLEKNSSKKP